MGKKTAGKSADIERKPQPHGGAILAGGVPGNKGGGRTPDEFKAMCRELVTREATWLAVQNILTLRDHPHYMSALKWAAEHGYGKPKETIDHTVSGEVTVRFARESNRRTAS